MFLFNQQLIERQKHFLETIQREERIQKLKEIASETVDINGIGNYTLGALIEKILTVNKLKNINFFLSNTF